MYFTFFTPGIIVIILFCLNFQYCRSGALLKSDHFARLVDLATKAHFDLSQIAKRGLSKAIVQVGGAIQDANTKEQYWLQTLQPLQNRFKEIISNESFSRTYHQENVKVQIIDILESIIGKIFYSFSLFTNYFLIVNKKKSLFISGVVQGVQSSTVDIVFQYTSVILNELPQLLSLYNNYEQVVQLILELFCECSKGMLCYLTEVKYFFCFFEF